MMGRVSTAFNGARQLSQRIGRAMGSVASSSGGRATRVEANGALTRPTAAPAMIPASADTADDATRRPSRSGGIDETQRLARSVPIAGPAADPTS